MYIVNVVIFYLICIVFTKHIGLNGLYKRFKD